MNLLFRARFHIAHQRIVHSLFYPQSLLLILAILLLSILLLSILLLSLQELIWRLLIVFFAKTYRTSMCLPFLFFFPSPCPLSVFIQPWLQTDLIWMWRSSGLFWSIDCRIQTWIFWRRQQVFFMWPFYRWWTRWW